METRIAAGIVAGVLFAACQPSASSSKSDSIEEKQAATQLASIFAKGTKIESSLSYGETSATISYADPPRYRGLTFNGAAGDGVDIWVRSRNGDSVAWLLDANFVDRGRG